MIAVPNNVDKTRWYAIHTHLRQEDRADLNLRASEVCTFIPKVREARRNPYTGEVTQVIKPLFTGYLFARFNIGDSLHRVQYTRGVHSIVSFGSKPIAVDEEIISVIKSKIGKDGYVRLNEKPDVGDEVAITDGPLKGIVGIFEREIKGTDRAMILLNTITYQVHIQVEKDLIRKSA
jgi:transcriptional antiterminator RfaH